MQQERKSVDFQYKTMIINYSNFRNYTIVFDESVAGAHLAADELNKYVAKSCDFSFSLNSETVNYISLGLNKYSKDFVDSFDNTILNNDGFRIAFKDDNIYIQANTPHGLFYAVCEFLERYLGIRWLTIDGEYVPKNKQIIIDETDIIKVPYFDQRVYFIGLSMHSAEYNAHLRFRYPNDYIEKMFNSPKLWTTRVPDPHNSLYYVSKEKYGETHPEFFIKSPMGGDDLCYSNGIGDDYLIDDTMEISVVKAAAQTMFEFIKDDPDVKFYMFGRWDDRTAVCQCETCKRRRQELGNETGVMIVFLNAVIKEVERKLLAENLPVDFNVVTLAYQMTVDPPLIDGKPANDKVIPSKRLHIRYAPIEADYTYSLTDLRQKETTRYQLLGWAKLTSNIMLWDYHDNYCEYCWYMPTFNVMKENLKTYANIKMSYVFNQSAYNINRHWLSEIKSYVASKLYWDLTLSVDDLIKEYVTLYYGIASESVLQFIYKMENFFDNRIKNGFHLNLFQDLKDFFNPKNYPIEFLLDSLKIVEDGIKKVQNSNLCQVEKEDLITKLNRVLVCPLRMISRNEDYYFPNNGNVYADRLFKVSASIGLDKFGEGVPMFVDIHLNGENPYKIILGQQPTEQEKFCAKLLQEKISKITGVTLEICDDSVVYPHYGERAIMVGKGMMFREFYKGTLNDLDYEYYVEVLGCCPFVLGDSLEKGVDVLVNKIYYNNGVCQIPAFKSNKLKQ